MDFSENATVTSCLRARNSSQKLNFIAFETVTLTASSDTWKYSSKLENIWHARLVITYFFFKLFEWVSVWEYGDFWFFVKTFKELRAGCHLIFSIEVIEQEYKHFEAFFKF